MTRVCCLVVLLKPVWHGLSQFWATTIERVDRFELMKSIYNWLLKYTYFGLLHSPGPQQPDYCLIHPVQRTNTFQRRLSRLGLSSTYFQKRVLGMTMVCRLATPICKRWRLLQFDMKCCHFVPHQVLGILGVEGSLSRLVLEKRKKTIPIHNDFFWMS